MKVKVSEVVGVNAISMQSGTTLYENIFAQLSAHESIDLDFEGVNFLASPFFNASVGLLLKDFDISELQQYLTFINLSDSDKQLLNLVISNAISFYAEGSVIPDALNSIDQD